MSFAKNVFQGMVIVGFAGIMGGISPPVDLPHFNYNLHCAPLIAKEREGFKQACADSTGSIDLVLKLIVNTRDQKLKKANCEVICEQWECEQNGKTYSARVEGYECQPL